MWNLSGNVVSDVMNDVIIEESDMKFGSYEGKKIFHIKNEAVHETSTTMYLNVRVCSAPKE